MFRRIHPLALTLIGLGIIGFFVKILTDPFGMLTTVLFIAVIIGVLVLLYKRFVNRSGGAGGEMSAYQRAAKQSAKRYRNQQQNRRKARRPSHLKLVNSRKSPLKRKTDQPTREKRKEDHNLTVIDGKKRKKKNRALF